MEPERSKDNVRKKRKVVQLSEPEVDDRKKHDKDAEKNSSLSDFADILETCEVDDKDNQREEGDLQEGAMSADMVAGIQEIRDRICQFTDQVSKLLENVKSFFIETSTFFEKRIVEFHQVQVDKWEEEIKLLATIDAQNEEVSFRLSNAQDFLNSLQ